MSRWIRPAVPQGTGELEVSFGPVEIVGARPDVEAVAAAIKSRLSGQTRPLSDLYAAAGELEQAYAAAGFPLTRVTVPPQRLVPGGPVKLMVIEGYIERIDLSAVTGRYRGFVWNRLAKLVGRRGVTQDEIERAVLLAGDAKGLSLRSAIAAGSQVGSAKLIVEGDGPLINGTASVDNRLPPSLGTWESSVSLALNDPFGFGEQVSLLLGTALNGEPGTGARAPLDIVGIGISAPVGDDGASIGFEYTHSITRPSVLSSAPTTVGRFDRAAVTLSYPWIRERAQTLSLEASADYIAQVSQVPLFGVDLERDAYATARIAATWDRTAASSRVWQVHGKLSQGLGGRGTTEGVGTPVSRLGASAYYTKLDIDAQVTQPLGSDFSVRVFARGQYAFGEPMFVSEQFALDTSTGVSGNSSGSFSVDSGMTFRIEVAKSFVTTISPASIVWSPYVFGGIGKGWLSRPTSAEIPSPLAGSFGLGLRTGVEGSVFGGLGLEVELARHYSNMPVLRTGNRVTLMISKRF